MDIDGNTNIIQPPCFTSWMRGRFSRTELRDIGKYGVKAGYFSLIDPSEVHELYGRFKDDIDEYIEVFWPNFSELIDCVEPDDMDDLVEKMTCSVMETLAEDLFNTEDDDEEDEGEDALINAVY